MDTWKYLSPIAGKTGSHLSTLLYNDRKKEGDARSPTAINPVLIILGTTASADTLLRILIRRAAYDL